jgi:hypothetical protein
MAGPRTGMIHLIGVVLYLNFSKSSIYEEDTIVQTKRPSSSIFVMYPHDRPQPVWSGINVYWEEQLVICERTLNWRGVSLYNRRRVNYVVSVGSMGQLQDGSAR